MTLNVDAAGLDQVPARQVVIPYKPRKHFLRLHESTKRWKFVCAHRRAGKSVSEINETIKKALQNKRQDPPPRYAYVGPSFAQTKDLIWGYLKHFTSTIPGVKYSESDLECTFPNGAKITLYGGAAAYERMRGLYFDGIVLDEFPLLNPAVFSTVVRPCLADYRGWAIVSGTSNGDDHFHELLKKNRKDDSWEIIIVPVTDTDALHPDEVIEMTKDMTKEEYAREMLCDFDAPIEGAYYAEQVQDLILSKRVTNVPYDPAVPVFTCWDLGISDALPIWFFQRVGRAIHFIDFLQNTGKGLEWYAKQIKAKPYVYATHILPPDVRARELGTGRSREEILQELLDDVFVCPVHRVEDGIAAVRSVLPVAYFDLEKTAEGFSAIKNYHRNKNGKPEHNWASHPADAIRYGAVSLNHVMGWSGYGSNVTSISGPLRRRIKGLV